MVCQFFHQAPQPSVVKKRPSFVIQVSVLKIDYLHVTYVTYLRIIIQWKTFPVIIANKEVRNIVIIKITCCWCTERETENSHEAEVMSEHQNKYYTRNSKEGLKNIHLYVSLPGKEYSQIFSKVSPSKATTVALNMAIIISTVPSLFMSAKTGGTIIPKIQNRVCLLYCKE